MKVIFLAFIFKGIHHLWKIRVFLLDLSLSSSSYSSLYGETPKIVNVPLELELESPEAKFLRESMGVDSSEPATTKP